MKLTRFMPAARTWLSVAPSRAWAVGTALTLAAGLTGYAAYGATGGATPAVRNQVPGAGDYATMTGATTTGQPGADVTAARHAPAFSTVTLVTGDKVRVVTGPDGRQSASPAGHAGTGAPSSSTFIPLSLGGDQYFFPASAVPYLGSALDPRLFDVSYLVRAGLDDARSATVPVTVTYRGAAAPSVSGLHVSHASAGQASGTLAKAQAPTLGSLLARQSAAAAAARHPAALPGAVPQVTSIALAAPKDAPALPASPFGASPTAPGDSLAATSAAAGQPGGASAYRTLKLALAGQSASTAFAFGIVQNVGDSQLDSSLGVSALAFGGVLDGLVNGQDTLRVSVPAGTYSAAFVFLTPDPGTASGFDSALVADPQFTVRGDTTVSLDARRAVPYQASVQGMTDSPQVRVDELQVGRSSLSGSATPEIGAGFGLISLSEDGQPASVLSAAPTAPVTSGGFTFDASSLLETDGQLSGGPPEQSPTYALDFPAQQQIPGSLTYTVRQADLAAVHTQAYQSSSGAFSDKYVVDRTCFVDGKYDIEALPGYDGSPLVEPLSADIYVQDGAGRTDYVYNANSRISVLQPLLAADDCGNRWAAPLRVQPGQQLTENWNKEPLVPGTALESFGLSPASCVACRQDDIGFVNLTAWGDSDASHYSNGFSWYGLPGDGGFVRWSEEYNQMSFYRDGTLALTSKGTCGSFGNCAMAPQGMNLPLLPKAASYVLDWSSPRAGDPDAVTDTRWDFTSAPGPAGQLPAGDQCAPDPARGCAFLPLLFVTYDLPLSLSNQATAGGPLQVAFTVAHQQDQAAPKGTTATVSASFDDGKTWSAPVAASGRGGNRFTAAVQQPPLDQTSGFASLRVTAKDAAGNSVTQTIIRAYGLTS